MAEKETIKKSNMKSNDSVNTKTMKDQKGNNGLHDVIISVESRKGGVGKTTAALSAAKVLAENGYAVLLIDCDVTGTNIACIIDSPFWKNDSVIVETDNKPCNLLTVFLHYIKDGSIDYSNFGLTKACKKAKPNNKYCVIGSSFTPRQIISFNKKSKEHSSLINSPLKLWGEFIDDEELPLYETKDLQYPHSLFDELMNDFFIQFLQRIIVKFKGQFKGKPVGIILDNSSGFFGYSSAIHDWVISLGPKEGKFIYVSSFDIQDIHSVFEYVHSLFAEINSHIASTVATLDCLNNKPKKFMALVEHKDDNYFLSKTLTQTYHHVNIAETLRKNIDFPFKNYYSSIISEKKSFPYSDFRKHNDPARSDYNFLFILFNKAVNGSLIGYTQNTLTGIPKDPVYYDSSLSHSNAIRDNIQLENIKILETKSSTSFQFPQTYEPRFIPNTQRSLEVLYIANKVIPFRLIQNYCHSFPSNDKPSINEITKKAFDPSQNKSFIESESVLTSRKEIANIINSFKTPIDGNIRFLLLNDIKMFFPDEIQLNHVRFISSILTYIVFLNLSDKDLDKDPITEHWENIVQSYKSAVEKNNQSEWLKYRERIINVNNQINQFTYRNAVYEKLNEVFTKEFEVIR
jgi:hypothetical protein